MFRHPLIFAFLVAAFVARPAGAQEKPAPARTPLVPSVSTGPRASEPDVRRLVELVGVVEKELSTIDVVMGMLKENMPTVPAKVWPEVRAELEKSFTRETILADYVPIYASRFNAEEVRQLIDFYSSPVGKKLVFELPFIETEAFMRGVERGQVIGERLRGLLKAKGFSVPST